jgi:ABC-type dipeptide/oligopeptide/nickel transport system ATPase component
MTALLEVTDLRVGFPAAVGWTHPVDGVSLRVAEGEALALVGASGSGKSLTALAIMGLVPRPGRVLGGSVRFEGEELLALPERRMRTVRGRRIGMVFQDPLASLNPVRRIGDQLVETLRAHGVPSAHEACGEAHRLLQAVGLPDPAGRLHAWPHQLSGGQRQRAMIALALAGGPRLLIADEPTSALDVTVQAEVLELLATLRRERGIALLLITHDLAVAATQADHVAVMSAGRIVEAGPVSQVLHAPIHPYTAALLEAVPTLLGGSQ